MVSAVVVSHRTDVVALSGCNGQGDSLILCISSHKVFICYYRAVLNTFGDIYNKSRNKRLAVQFRKVGNSSTQSLFAVVELLTVGYFDGAVVLVGSDADAVGRLVPAEGDVSVAGVDALAVAAATSSVDDAAVDGDVVGVDALADIAATDGVDDAAVDGDVTAPAFQPFFTTVGCDGATVDGDGVLCEDGILLVAFNIERAAVYGESVAAVDSVALAAVVSDGDVAAVHVDAADDGDAAVVILLIADAVYIKFARLSALSVDG